ncbi:MAG TPA: outer membrane protein [Pseudolabrys sp.]|jgi:outer membrane immunogenic protein
MRRHHYLLALAGLATAALNSSASAADLPRKALPYAPAYYAPVWSGFYAGVNAGYGWANFDDGVSSSKMNGFIGGGQLGYNWQLNSFVLGVEGDIQYSAQKRTESATIGGTVVTGEAKVPWFGTARGRLGYAFDSVMIYGTGGAAWSNLKASVTALGATVSTDTTKMGWTAGAGVEWMFLPRWSVKAEYLYIDSGSTTLTVAGVSASGKLKDNIGRVGVNYHF